MPGARSTSNEHFHGGQAAPGGEIRGGPQAPGSVVKPRGYRHAPVDFPDPANPIFLNRSVEGTDWPARMVRSLTQWLAWAGGAHAAGTLPQFGSCCLAPPPLNHCRKSRLHRDALKMEKEHRPGSPPLPALKPWWRGACTHTHTHSQREQENKRPRVGVDSGGEALLGIAVGEKQRTGLSEDSGLRA